MGPPALQKMVAGGRLPRLQQNFTLCGKGRKYSWYGKAPSLSGGLFLFSKIRACLEVEAVEGCCKWVGRCIKCPTHLKAAALVHGGDAPGSHGAARGAGAAGFQGAVSGAEIYAMFDKKKVRFGSSWSQLLYRREAAAIWLLVYQSHTLWFGSGDQVPRDTGNSPCSRTEHLVKIFSFYKNNSDFFKPIACPFMKQS